MGTGTGIWAIDVADQYPEAIVMGVGLSAIQPSWVPQNCKFELEDFNDKWSDFSTPLTYDLIHARELLGTVPDWTAMYQKAYEALEPGGLVRPSRTKYSFSFGPFRI